MLCAMEDVVMRREGSVLQKVLKVSWLGVRREMSRLMRDSGVINDESGDGCMNRVWSLMDSTRVG